ncbi:MAG: DNA polymerase III subunit alpha [Candidatus Magasanikbacteria bacterium]|nr:DNA polymerase III subunit alpha [Candidatus Magasanikbacteria bacterium]
MDKFVHLHVHSHYSLLDGLTQIKPLVKAAKERGFSALALTDGGSMYGAVEFYEACRSEEIKPIIGFEAYLGPRKLTDKDPQADKELYHLILLAENYEGYKNLMCLSSIGHLEGFFNGKPRIDKEIIKKYHGGIIGLSGCIRGEVPQLLKQGDLERAKKAALGYNEIFCQGNFYLELQDHPAIEGQLDVNTKIIQLSKDAGIPMVVTRDAHYLNQDDAEAQDILTCIREGWKVDQMNREDFRQVDRSLNSAKDIISRFRHVPDAIENTVKIAERVNLEINLNAWHFAPVELPADKSASDVMEEVVRAKANEYYSPITDEVRARLEYELKVIKEKSYAPYFLCVADYVNYAKAHGIVETTRGSAAGSIVSYVMGITTVDPIKFKLPFERFLNPFRPSPPDIDTDFADDRRDEMIDYVTNKYGREKVAQIITFGTMAARASVRDVGRALGYSYTFCDQVAKLIPMGSQGFPMTIERALVEEPDLKKLYGSKPEVKRLLDLAQKVEGCARHTSIHAAGVVISPTELTDFTPIQKETGGEKIITQYEMHAVESAGLLKMDFLGIRNLSILGKAVEFVEKTMGEKIDVYKLPLDDKETFAMLARGETMGTFQLGGSGMTRWLKELKPTTIDDIMAMVALYRPGPMESIPEYIRRKHNPKSVEYLDPRMAKYLGVSFGLLVYQDDVLLTAIELAGYDWMEVDKFRKAIGKKIPEEMEKQKIKFFQGCRDHGQLPEEKIHRLWETIEPFAAYGFNKCLVGDTEIVDYNSGGVRTIQDIFKDGHKLYGHKLLVLSLSNDARLKARKISKIYRNGKKNVWKITTRSGRKITATSNHPFLKFGGWCNLCKLKVGDMIATPRVIDYKPSVRIDDRRLRALGLLLSEGNLCHPHGIYFYSALRLEIHDFIRQAKVFKNVKIKVNDSKSAISVYVGKKKQGLENELFVWIKNLGLLGKKATEKFIPDFVFRLSQKQIACLIGAMWQGDGCVHNDKFGQIYYATSSEKLARGLQHLLLRLGILSAIHTKSFKYRGGHKRGFTINISRYNNVDKFARRIGPHLIGDKKKALKKLVKGNTVLSGSLSPGAARGSKDVIPASVMDLIRRTMVSRRISVKRIARGLDVAERLFYGDHRRKGYLRETIEKIGVYLRSKEIIGLARSDIYWDEIKDIKYRGRQETYDLTVPDGHNFVANDFIVHNSHAASYGTVAYQTAYMKAHYPVQYMTAILQAESGDTDKVAEIVPECRRMGIDVLPPDVNESFRNFAIPSASLRSAQDKGLAVPRVIRFGLNAIKNLGEHISDVIYRERKERGPYQSLENFLERADDKDLNKKSIESLAKCGALDCFGYDRGVLLHNIENILFFVRERRERKSASQDSLFAGLGIVLDNKVKLDEARPAGMDEKLKWEKELLGLYVSAHPFDYFQKVMARTLLPLNQVEESARDGWVVIGGVIDSIKKKLTKKGSIMIFATIQDTTGMMELLVFPSVYEQTQSLWQEGNIICVVGKTPKERGDNKVFVEKARPLTKESALRVCQEFASESAAKDRDYASLPQDKAVVLNLTKEELKIKARELKDVFIKYPGDYQVFVKVAGNLIRAQAMIDWNSEVEDELKKVVGGGRVEVNE